MGREHIAQSDERAAEVAAEAMARAAGGKAPAPSAKPEVKVEDPAKKDEEARLAKEEESKAKAAEGETEDQKKARIRSEAEESVKADRKLLTTNDNDLNEDQKKRKEDLVKLQRQIKAEEKENKRNREVEQRIQGLTDKIKEQGKTVEEVAALKKEIEDLKKGSVKVSDEDAKKELKAKLVENAKARYKTQLEEDKELPRGERREMSDDELEDYLLEDTVGAHKWMVRQELRRQQELADDEYKSDTDVKVEAFKARQNASRDRTIVKHPELDTSKRYAELKAEGKTPEEINGVLMEENPKYKLFMEIIFDNKESQKKYLSADNGPELVVAEMEKRLAKGAEKPAVEDDDAPDFDEAVQAEIARREAADGASSVNSSAAGGGGNDETFGLTKEQQKVANLTGTSFKGYAYQLKRRSGIQGT